MESAPALVNTTIYQIFYDTNSLSRVESGYLPLDNTDGRAGWYEFWPILNFLRNNAIGDDDWFGFLSPAFQSKANFSHTEVYEQVQAAQKRGYDVMQFLVDWQQVAFFKNGFEQGDQWHPGLIEAADAFLRHIKSPINSVKDIVGTTNNTVFSNYFVARGVVWKAWREMAEALATIIEDAQHPLHATLCDDTKYRGGDVPMFIFMQERLIQLVLQQTAFKSQTAYRLVTQASMMFEVSPENMDRLKNCNDAKIAYHTTRDLTKLAAYWDTRLTVIGSSIYCTTPAALRKKLYQLYGEARYADCLAEASELAKRYPKCAEILLICGANYLALGQHTVALALIEKSLRIQPHSERTKNFLELTQNAVQLAEQQRMLRLKTP